MKRSKKKSDAAKYAEELVWILGDEDHRPTLVELQRHLKRCLTVVEKRLAKKRR